MEYSFPLMFQLFGEKIVAKYTINPAIIHNLFPKKGIIQEGSDADFVVFDPNSEVNFELSQSNSDYSAYEGMKIKGEIISTILRGQFLVENREFVGKPGGQFISR